MIIFVFTSCWLGLFALKIYDDCFRDFSENRLSFDLTEGRFLGEKVIFLIHDTVLNFRWLSQILSKAKLSQYFLKTSFCCLLILLETFSIFAKTKHIFCSLLPPRLSQVNLRGTFQTISSWWEFKPFSWVVFLFCFWENSTDSVLQVEERLDRESSGEPEKPGSNS